MTRKSSKTIRRSAGEIPKPRTEELDRLKTLPEGTPDEENPEWTPEQVAAAVAARHQRPPTI